MLWSSWTRASVGPSSSSVSQRVRVRRARLAIPRPRESGCTEYPTSAICSRWRHEERPADGARRTARGRPRSTITKVVGSPASNWLCGVRDPFVEVLEGRRDRDNDWVSRSGAGPGRGTARATDRPVVRSSAAAATRPSPRMGSMHPSLGGWVFHSRWRAPDAGPYSSHMSPDAHLSLSEGQEHDVSEWEKAAAAVLRKARRLSDDDAGRRGLGEAHAPHAGRHRHQPARHPRARGGPARPGAPTCPGRRLGRPRPAGGPRREGRARRGPHRPRERRHVAVDPGRSVRRRCRGPRHRARRCAPRRRAGRARRPL